MQFSSIKYEYQHYIPSTNGSISIDISIFGGKRFKKAPGASRYLGFDFKKNWISHLFGQRQKSNTKAC